MGILTGFLIATFASALHICYGYGDYIRCDVDEECPAGARCYRDDCARCECPLNHYVTNYVVDDVGSIKTCIKDEISQLVGGECGSNYDCPYGSVCRESRCVCEDGLVEVEDRSECRYALFGERCGHVECEYGLACEGHPPLCQCAADYTSPDPWRRFVDERWNIKSINIYTDCVPRSIGDGCSHHHQCEAIGGSAARCKCNHCACATDSHVPDVHGTTCGPALEFGELCHSMRQRVSGVCDGRQGLQCGSPCVAYREDTYCTCSNMHDLNGTSCLPKSQGSPCVTDQDCYLLTGGFGICENRTCTLAAVSTEHIPRNLHRKCHRWKDTTTPAPAHSTDHSTNPNHSTSTAVATSRDVKPSSTSSFLDSLTTVQSLVEEPKVIDEETSKDSVTDKLLPKVTVKPDLSSVYSVEDVTNLDTGFESKQNVIQTDSGASAISPIKLVGVLHVLTVLFALVCP